LQARTRLLAPLGMIYLACAKSVANGY